MVIDTNVVVSANLSDEGPPAAILDLAANHNILMFVWPAILAEYEAVLRRPRLNLSHAAVVRSLALIRNISRLVKPTRGVTAAADETDNRFLECAISGGVDYIITGNARHFPKRFEGIKIVTPRQFLDLVAPEFAENRQKGPRRI